jgi:hypothetical protein
MIKIFEAVQYGIFNRVTNFLLDGKQKIPDKKRERQ